MDGHEDCISPFTKFPNIKFYIFHHFQDKIDDARFAGHMFGIGSTSFNPPPGWLIPPSHNKDNSNYSEKNNNKKIDIVKPSNSNNFSSSDHLNEVKE